MKKKDYELIAEVLKQGRTFPIEIRECGNNPKYTSHDDLIATCMSNILASKNPRFNRDKFLKACGVEYSYPCEKCGGKRDVEARICNNCH